MVIRILLMMLLTAPIYADDGYIKLNTDKGDGWCYIWVEKYGRWLVYESFPSRLIKLPTGKYAVAFDDTFNLGYPSTRARFRVATVESNRVSEVKN